MSAWTIYWFTRLDTLQMIGFLVGILSGIGLLIAGILYQMMSNGDDYDKDMAKQVKPFRNFALILCCCTLPLGIFLPSSKEFAAIYLIPKIVNNEQVQQIPSKGLDLLNAKLDQWLDDVRKDKEKK